MIELNEILNIIDELNGEELEEVKKRVNACLGKNKKSKKVIYKHECFNSSSYHLNKYKHFAKVLKQIDDNKDNGYAFIGDFLPVNKESFIEEGSYIIEVCHTDIFLYQIQENEKLLKLNGKYNKLATFISEAKEITQM